MTITVPMNLRPDLHPMQVFERGYNIAMSLFQEFLGGDAPGVENVIGQRIAIFAAALYLRMYNENATTEEFSDWLHDNWTPAVSSFERTRNKRNSYTKALRIAFSLVVHNLVSMGRIHNIYAELGLHATRSSTCTEKYTLSSSRVADLNILARCGRVISYQEAFDYYQGDLKGHPFYTHQNMLDLALLSRIFAANPTKKNSAMTISLAASLKPEL